MAYFGFWSNLSRFCIAASKRNIQIENTEQLLELASTLNLNFEPDSANNALGVYLDNQEVSSELRTEKTAELASKFAMIGQLRELSNHCKFWG